MARDAQQAAASLRREAGSKVAADGDTHVIELDREAPDLLWQLAELRHAIAVRQRSVHPLGTGPFRIDRLEPAHVVLRAHEDHWQGRPFVDGVDVAMDRSPADQLASLEVGRVDIASVGPADSPRLAARGLRIAASRPIDLVALVFAEHRATPAGQPLRNAVSAAIDRASPSTVLLPRGAQPALALLPECIR